MRNCIDAPTKSNVSERRIIHDKKQIKSVDELVKKGHKHNKYYSLFMKKPSSTGKILIQRLDTFEINSINVDKGVVSTYCFHSWSTGDGRSYYPRNRPENKIEMHLADMGVIPYADGTWNSTNYLLPAKDIGEEEVNDLFRNLLPIKKIKKHKFNFKKVSK